MNQAQLTIVSFHFLGVYVVPFKAMEQGGLP